MERTLTLKPDQELATLAGGCFWGMEDILRKIDGIDDTEVGYTGGGTTNPVYETVKVGNTGHAEAIQVVFRPAVISYRELLKWFFKMHDPTTRNQQGNDKGSQYRSAIFHHSEAQRETALAEIKAAEAQWKKPVVTELVAAKPFYSAEKFHQDYLEKNPGGYTCHYVRKF